MEHTSLRKVTADSQQWCVKARVVRFSEFLSTEDSTKLIRLDFVMVDEEGGCMEGQIPRACVDKYRAILAEDNVYYLRYFEVDKARSSYRPVDHPYLARLTRFTEVYPVPAVPQSFPRYGCKVAPFAVLRQRAGKKLLMSDAIGLMTKSSHANPQSTKYGMKSIRTVHITDGSETAVVTLWGPQADQFNAEAYMAMGAQNPVVLLFAGVTTSVFEGRLRLQASTSCRWYENPELPEASALRQRFGFTVGRPEWIGAVAPAAALAPSTCCPHPMLISVVLIATNVLRASENPQGNRYNVVATLKSLIPDQAWWYHACGICNRKTRPSGDSYICSDTDCSGTTAEYRYCLTFLATDPAADPAAEEHLIELVCFGPTGEELTGVPAEVLVTVTGASHGSVPEHILRLYGRQYEFRVSVSRSSLRRNNRAFKVDAILRALPPPPALQYIEAAGAAPGSSAAAADQGNEAQPAAGQVVPAAPLATPKVSPESPPGTPASVVLQPEDLASSAVIREKRARQPTGEDASLEDDMDSATDPGKKARHAKRPNRKLNLDLSPDTDASSPQS
ncbi:hypothetical protein ACP70R_000306 [Stipagrostis hirtigluma subsp. patula]